MSSGNVKWLVLGVIALVVIVVFKDDIRHILRGASEVEISPSGLKIKTTQTLLGQAEVSNVSVQTNKVLGEGIMGNTYVSRKYSFRIEWPVGNDWNANETMGKSLLQQYGNPSTMDVPIIVLKNEMVGNFRPNVNVVVETIGNMDISSYIAKSIQSFQQQGWQVLTNNVDEATQGAFLSFYNTSFSTRLYQFQRIAVANGKAFIITASQLPTGDALSQNLKQELLGILNSFRIFS